MSGSFKAIAMLCILIYSCTSKTNNEETIIKALDESITVSNQSISKESRTSIQSLQNKLYDPVTSEHAKYYYPKAEFIRQLSDTMLTYIENLKQKLIIEPVSYLSETDKEKLYNKLQAYKNDIIQSDPLIDSAFTGSLFVITEAFDSIKNTAKDFSHTFFNDASLISTLAVLNKFQNNILVNETRILRFYNYHFASIDDTYYSSYSAIITQSSSYVQPGERIEIIAGVGSFSKAALPEITVNGKIITLNESGFLSYKVKSPNKPGRYYTPVKISFTDQVGMRQTIEKNIEYTVAGEKEN